MAAPTVRGRALDAASAVSAPAATQVGDLLIFFHHARTTSGAPGLTIQGGYTEIRNLNGTDCSQGVARILASVSGAQSYQPFSSGGSTNLMGMVVLAAGTFDVNGIICPVGVAVASSAEADPPAATGLIATRDYLAICCAGYKNASASVSLTPPTGYGNLQEYAFTLNAALGVAEKVLAPGVSSENPGTWADNISPSESIAHTIVIPNALPSGDGWGIPIR